HREILALSAYREATVLLGNRDPERADPGQPLDDALGNVEVVAVDLLGHLTDLLLGKPPERVLDQLEIGVEVSRALHAAQLAEIIGRPVGAHEACSGVERPSVDAPYVLTPQRPRRNLIPGVGDEGTRDAR